MAIWDKIGASGTVDDRRGTNSGRLALSGGSVVIALIMSLILGYMGVDVSPNDFTNLVNQFNSYQDQQVDKSSQAPEFKGLDSYEKFTASVMGSTDEMWRDAFSRNNLEYQEPRLVLYRGFTESGCGIASSATGPHYCPYDNSIYLDETFFDELHQRYGGSKGETAQAYVIAHEVGHHVQNQLGLLGAMQSGSNQQETSIKLELQADCYAGLWVNSIKDLGVFEEGDIEQALSAVSAVGDDRIQEQTQGRITPENWTHGSSEQRTSAFMTGYSTGKVSSCNIDI